MKSKKRRSSSSVTPDPSSAATQPAVEKTGLIFAVVLLAVASFFRLAWLGRAELWQDELGFFKYAHTGWSLGQVLKNSWELVISIGQMPLAFAIHNLAYRAMELVTAKVTPFTPGLARLPAAIFGIAGVWACYRLAARVFDPALARLSAVGVAVMFFPVYYAREVYVYAQMWVMAPLSILYLTKVMDAEKMRGRDAALAVVMLAALLYSHLGALMLAGAIGLVLFCFWLADQKTKNRAAARRSFTAMLLTGAALLLASPYILRFVLFDKAHTGGSEYSIWIIVNDAVSKMFMGERPVMSAISWVALLCGLVSLCLPHAKRRPRIFMAAITALGVLAIVWATKRSQYLSARYFTPVAPFMILVMLQGVWQAGVWVAGLFRLPTDRRACAGLALAAIPILVHATLFTPALLRLTEKSTSFGSAARWINENLPSGVPYVMESAYEIRWVGESFPTPNHPPASPFVHGAGPQQLELLHEKQSQFMTRFPEAPFIESSHHNWNTPEGVWKWPHEHFAQRVILGSPEAAKRLIRMGIFPGFPHETLSDYSYRVDIYFNRLSDRVERARSSPVPVLTIPEGWKFSGQQVSPQETLYFRVGRAADSSFRLMNVGSNNLRGALALTIGASGPPNTTADVVFSKGADTLSRVTIPAGQFAEAKISIASLPVGESQIRWRGSGANGTDVNLILFDAKWVAE